MTLFDDIKIIGIDANRPPRIRKEPYIDLFYQLSRDAPQEWCEDFEGYGRQLNPMAKIDKTTRCFINTYVNDMNLIPAHFEQIKEAVANCNIQFQEKLTQREAKRIKDHAELQGQDGQQFMLNEIVGSLDFES